MSRRIFHKLVSADEVINILSRYVELKPRGVDEVHISNALGRVLADDVYAPIDYPPFDRSEVDGYAVRAEDTYGADEEHPVKLRVKGSVSVGMKPRVSVGSGEAVEIATGAPIPKGANAVVMEEHTHRYDDEVLIYKAVAPGDNVASAASDISLGDLVLRRGVKLEPPHIALLAGLGIERVKVFKRIRVAVFSTGNEVIRPGSRIDVGLIYDSNSYFLVSALRELGVEANYVGHLPDNYDVMINELSNALKNYDVIITSGGTSAGLGDLVYRVFDNLGNPGVVIHGLKIKPGKPTVFAVVNDKILIGMPGFPLSCMMVFYRVVGKIISLLSGITTYGLRRSIKAYIPYRLRTGKGREWLIPVALVSDGVRYIAYPVTLSSGSISALTFADGYIRVSEDKEILMENEEVEVHLFKEITQLPKIVFIGSHDIALWRILTSSELIDKAKVVSVGSLRGWYAVKSGEADIAPTHLLDEESGEYNVPYLSKLGLKGKAVIVRGYRRRIGFIVPKGNPKGIKTFRDLLRDDVMFVNRVKGSGIRTFVDAELKKLANNLNIRFKHLVNKIHGYTYEVRTHTAVASAVKHGRADVGVAAEIAARMYDLDFIPLTTEVVDFLVRKDRMGKAEVKYFIKLLGSSKVREILKELPGYDVMPETGLILG